MPLPDFNLHLKGYVGDWDFDSDYVDYVVGVYKGKPLHVRIDSLGGQLNTALSISAAFARHGDVHVHYSGMNASAATIAGMSAKEITIESNALWLVHNSSSLVDVYRQANASDMAEIIESLQKRIKDHDAYDAAVAQCYAKRCKKTPEELVELLAEDRWMTAQEALEWGFVDSIVELETPAKAPAESVVCAMKEAGIPIPKQYRAPNLLEKVSEAVSSALEACGLKKTNSLNSENMENQQTSPEVSEETQVVESQESSQNSEASASNEAATEVADSDIEALRRELKNANDRIAELEKRPGDETQTVVTTAEAATQSPAGSFVSDIAAARDLMGAVGL